MSNHLYTLDPLDTLFFGDGSGFDAGSDTDATGLPLPTPFTLNGMVRAALLGSSQCNRWELWHKECAGCDRLNQCGIRPAVGSRKGLQDGEPGRLRIRGPWVMRHGEVLVPAPLDLIAESDAIETAMSDRGGQTQSLTTFLLQPEVSSSSPLGVPLPDGLHHLKPQQEVEKFSAVPGWLAWSAFVEWVTGAAPQLVRHHNWFLSRDLYGTERRGGTAIDPTSGHARQGFLYFANHMRLREGVSLAIEVDGVDDVLAVMDAPRALPLGGEMRTARWQRLTVAHPWGSGPAAEPWHSALASATRIKWLLTHPAYFKGGWRPSIPNGWRLVAARTERAERITGFNALTGNPRPLAAFVPAGAVYFLERDPASNAYDATARFPACRSETPDTLPEPVAFDAMGFGFTIPATW